MKASQEDTVDVEVLVKDGWVHDFYGDYPIEICSSCVVFNNEACQAFLPNGLVFNNKGLPAKDMANFMLETKGQKTYDELIEIFSSPDATWGNAWEYYYEIYKTLYLSCASKGPKIGGDHAQETIDIAVPFFVEALK